MEVEMKIRGLMMDPATNMPIVILKDVNSNTVLPIWVGIYEANAIALEIEDPYFISLVAQTRGEIAEAKVGLTLEANEHDWP